MWNLIYRMVGKDGSESFYVDTTEEHPFLHLRRKAKELPDCGFTAMYWQKFTDEDTKAFHDSRYSLIET